MPSDALGIGEQYQYRLKGAERRLPTDLGERRATEELTRARCSSLPVTSEPSWETLRALAPPAALSPAGHGGGGARPVPGGPPHRFSTATISSRRAGRKNGPSSRRSSVKPGKITRKSASRHT
jgi:hypothetical protein